MNDTVPGFREATYHQAITTARGLIEDGAENTEYVRGIAELIADLWGIPGVFLAERKFQVADDLGVPRSSVT